MFTLIIKGDPSEALIALGCHIPLDGLDAEVKSLADNRQTAVVVKGDKAYLYLNATVLNYWMTEAPLQTPFPVGTLLYWRDHDRD